MDDSDDSTDIPSEQDFHCSCCYELMVNPTTLNCGHNFCRFCLAHWWYSSRKTTCPECRQPWQGFPSVNFLLRKTIKKLFPNELTERKATLENSQNYDKIMHKFESFGKKRASPRTESGGQHNNRWVLATKGVAIAAGTLGILMFLYDFLAILVSSGEPLVSKPVAVWTPEDVSKWVASLGPWARGTYEKRFLDAGINGMVLVSLTEADLEEPLLDINVTIHRRALMQALESVKNLGVKPPTDLWEYKAAHPVRCMFLLWGFREFPRATAVYIFFALHDEVLTPLLYHTSEHDEDDIRLDPNEPWYPPTIEYTRFMFRILLTPYYLIGKFAFKWVLVNSWTVGIVLMYCLLMTASELVKIRWLVMGGWKELPMLMWQNTSTVLGNGFLHLVIWHFVPSFICDMFFYWMLFLSPVYAWSLLKTSWYEADQRGTIPLARLVVSWLWRRVAARVGI